MYIMHVYNTHVHLLYTVLLQSEVRLSDDIMPSATEFHSANHRQSPVNMVISSQLLMSGKQRSPLGAEEAGINVS